MKHPDPLSASYTARQNFPVLLTVTSGNGQMTSIAVWVDDKLLDAEEFNRTKIGVGGKIQKVQIRADVTDVNPHSNRMIVAYILEGSPDPLLRSQSFEVDENGDTATFRAKFTLST